MLATNGNGFKHGMMRHGGTSRTVTFIVAGLLVISVLLLLNFWYVSGQRNDLKEELEMLETRYQALQRSKKNLEAKYETANEKVKKATVSKEKVAENAATLENNLKETKTKLESVSGSVDELKAQLETKEKELSEKKEEYRKLNETLQSTVLELTNAKKQFEENSNQPNAAKVTTTTDEPSIDDKMKVREKLRENENLVNSKETDPLMQKAVETDGSKVDGKRYQVSGEDKTKTPEKTRGKTSKNAAPADQVVSDKKEKIEEEADQQAPPVLKKPKLNTLEEPKANRTGPSGFGGLAKFAENRKEVEPHRVKKTENLKETVADEISLNDTQAEKDNVTADAVLDETEDLDNNTADAAQVIPPPKMGGDEDETAQQLETKPQESSKLRAQSRKGSEEKPARRKHKHNRANSTATTEKPMKTKGEEEEKVEDVKPKVEEGGLLDEKPVKEELNATKNVATEEKDSAVGKIDKAVETQKETDLEPTKRPALRREADNLSAGRKKTADVAAAGETVDKTAAKKLPAKEADGDEDLPEDDTDAQDKPADAQPDDTENGV